MRLSTVIRPFALLAALGLAACAQPGMGGGAVACSGGGNTLLGAGAGALGGGLLGNMAGKRDGRNTRTLGGAAAGGLIGGLLGAMTERPCAPSGGYAYQGQYPQGYHQQGYGYGGPVAVHPAAPPIHAPAHGYYPGGMVPQHPYAYTRPGVYGW